MQARAEQSGAEQSRAGRSRADESRVKAIALQLAPPEPRLAVGKTHAELVTIFGNQPSPRGQGWWGLMGLVLLCSAVLCSALFANCEYHKYSRTANITNVKCLRIANGESFADPMRCPRTTQYPTNNTDNTDYIRSSAAQNSMSGVLQPKSDYARAFQAPARRRYEVARRLAGSRAVQGHESRVLLAREEDALRPRRRHPRVDHEILDPKLALPLGDTLLLP